MNEESESEKKDGKRADIQDCSRACTTVVQFMTDVQVPAVSGTSTGAYTSIDGYRYINIFVKFNQQASNELPVDLSVGFAFDSNGEMAAGRFVNLEQNLASQQHINLISISGDGSWNGTPPGTSSYTARLPVLGPFIQVFPFNRAPATRTVSIWGYLVS
jgi:hypothetical protein